MPEALQVLYQRMIKFYVNSHISQESERFDADILISGFYDGARQIPGKGLIWDVSLDERRLHKWVRYKFKIQIWDINGLRTMLFKAKPQDSNTSQEHHTLPRTQITFTTILFNSSKYVVCKFV